MSENKKFIYQSPMNSGILPDLYTGLKYDGSMLFPYLTTPPIQKKYSDSCSSKLKQVVDCLKNNNQPTTHTFTVDKTKMWRPKKGDCVFPVFFE